MINVLTAILFIYLGYIIGIIHASITSMKEREADKKDLDNMSQSLAKMMMLLDKLLGEEKKDAEFNENHK